MADSDNLPIAKPGAYIIWNRINGKTYIGISQNVKKRLTAHAGHGSPRRLNAAMQKYGTRSFVVIPLFYLITDALESLLQIEVDLIVMFDTVNNGYNVVEAAGRTGPYGELFGAIQSASWSEKRRMNWAATMKNRWNDPDYRAQVKATMKANPDFGHWPRSAKSREQMSESAKKRKASPATRAKLSIASTGRQHKPETRARLADIAAEQWRDVAERDKKIAGINNAFAKPEVKLNQSRAAVLRYSTAEQRQAASRIATEINARPGMKERKSATIKATVLITDGTQTIRIKRGIPIPNGWRIGWVHRSRK